MSKQSYLADVKAELDAEIAALRAQGVGVALRVNATRPRGQWDDDTGVDPFQAWGGDDSGMGDVVQWNRMESPEEKLKRREREARQREALAAYAQLERRMRFLTNLRRELDNDPQLVGFIDSMVGNQVKAAERRQRIYSAIIAVVSLLAGWLLSAISPATTLAHMFPH